MAVSSPSRQTLDAVPSKTITFLIAVGEYPVIRAALGTKGYDQEEHDFAWSLLGRLGKFPVSNGLPPQLDSAVRNAIVELDTWDEPNFAIILAALERHYPEVASFVFENLEPKQGPESVLGIGTLLERLDALEKSPDRSATRKTDEAALAMLAKRGYSASERARLRALILTAQTVVFVAPISGEEREKTVLQLYRWLNDWMTVAKTVITRRDHLIRIGAAKRRAKAKGKAKAGDTTSNAAVPADAAGAASATNGAPPVATAAPSVPVAG